MSRTRTVLVMDDNPDILTTLQDILEIHGYRVLTILDGESGLKTAIEEVPDLVILDMMLPKMSGFIVLRKLRQKMKTLPIVMISANGASHHQAYAESLGANEFLQKPFGLSELLEVVQRLCPIGASEPAALFPGLTRIIQPSVLMKKSN